MSDKDVPEEKVDEKGTPDKKQIEAEEKEKMLKEDKQTEDEDGNLNDKPEGPVKSALATSISDEGREVKPKFIPIGGIKMPGFFTRARSKERVKDVEDGGDADVTDVENNEGGNANNRSKRATQIVRDFWTRVSRPSQNQGNNADGYHASDISNRARQIINGIKQPLTNILPRRGKDRDPEAALASMETLDEGRDATKAPDDGMETVKLSEDEPNVAPPRLHWRERVRQKKFIMDDVIVGVAVIVIVAIVVGITLALVGTGSALREAPVRNGLYVTAVTGCGPVEGVLDDGAIYFHGIPYARPPTGDLRWQPAQALNSLNFCWNGTFQAHNVTPPCMQMLENGSIVGQEDCLTVDVVTPRVRYDSPLPVIILLGGPSLAGGLEPELRPAPRYARSKDVVFVRPNFRLGLLGFLSIEGLSQGRGHSGNYGLSDVVASLNWVQLNIQHFGGDPKNVCILAHRAGATLAGALLESWRHKTVNAVKKRPFARMWLSGGGWAMETALSRQDADAEGRRAASLAGCAEASPISCLRKLDAARLLTSAPEDWRPRVPDLPPAGVNEHSWFVREEHYDPPADEPVYEMKPGEVVIGATEHAGHSRTLLLRHGKWTPELVSAAIKGSFLETLHLDADALTMYNESYIGLVSLVSDLTEVCPSYFLSRKLNTPFYLIKGDSFQAQTDTSLTLEEEAEESLVGAGWDAAAIVGQVGAKTTQRRHRITALQQMFYHWVWHGTPGGPAGERAGAIVTVEQDPIPVSELPNCQFWIEKKVVPRYARLD